MTVPTGYYFIKKRSTTEIMQTLVTSVVGIWPFIVISIFLAFVFGFICWLLEKGTNSEQFPHSFPSGIWQGFWWSIVSMTTVGYDHYFYFSIHIYHEYCKIDFLVKMLSNHSIMITVHRSEQTYFFRP